MRRNRTIAAGVATTLMSAVLVMLPAAPASAQTALCTKAVNVNRGGHNISVPATGSNNTDCLIGRTSAANTTIVKHLQRTLKVCYASVSLASPYQDEKVGNLADDGQFGPRTEAALKAVQSRIGTNSDGVYGRNTRDRISFRSNDVPSPPCYRY